MMAAARIGERIGVTPPAVAERQQALFERYELPTRLPGLDAADVIDATSRDKKVASGRLRWVLLEDFGRPVIRDDVPREVVRDVLKDVLV